MSAADMPLPPPSARSLLVTVLGELVYPENEPVWTSALVSVLGALGIERNAARQAISRAATAGWIEGERKGRAVRWRLAAGGRELVADGIRRTDAFVEEPPAWDGRWLVLFVTVPQSQRTMRARLYGGLTWLGLGNPTPGVWLTPHSSVLDEVRTLIAEFGLQDGALAFIGAAEDVGIPEGEIVRRSWDLSDLSSRYASLLEIFGALRPESSEQLLVAHLRLRNLLQRFLRIDPELPHELNPDWIGREGAALFRDRRSSWTGPARREWAAIVARSGPEPG